jgi:hypothetical protein
VFVEYSDGAPPDKYKLGYQDAPFVIGFLNLDNGCGTARPAFHPLEVLIQRIEHPTTGERFTPILELLNIHTGMNWNENHYAFFAGNNEVYVRQKNNSQTAFGYNFENGFFSISSSGNHCFVQNQKELWAKLFEWHIWIYDQKCFASGDILLKSTPKYYTFKKCSVPCIRNGQSLTLCDSCSEKAACTMRIDPS